MNDCEQCTDLQRQNDLLANDRDGYVQLLTNENNKLRAANEKMRSALERIDRMRAAYEDGRDVLVAKIGVMQDIVRAALEEKQ